MTCGIIIQGPNGSTAQARTLLHSGPEVSFFTAIGLIWSSCPTPHVRPRGLVDIKVTDVHQTGKVHSVWSFVLTKTMSSTPACPLSELDRSIPCWPKPWDSLFCGSTSWCIYRHVCLVCPPWLAVWSLWNPFSLWDSIQMGIERHHRPCMIITGRAASLHQWKRVHYTATS